VWGKVFEGGSRAQLYRIIPTRVGKSALARRGFAQRSDHPHACGEKSDVPSGMNLDNGSSPRVWGKENKSIDLADGQRIIPTRVGKRREAQSAPWLWPDHPHACGEKIGLS